MDDIIAVLMLVLASAATAYGGYLLGKRTALSDLKAEAIRAEIEANHAKAERARAGRAVKAEENAQAEAEFAALPDKDKLVAGFMEVAWPSIEANLPATARPFAGQLKSQAAGIGRMLLDHVESKMKSGSEGGEGQAGQPPGGAWNL